MIAWMRQSRMRMVAFASVAAYAIGYLLLGIAHLIAHVLNLPHPG